ncbi:NAD(P)H-dependent oxidoreductase [Arthrobacter sp. NPDC056727]|uniref:NAD(P)H-dependent oxidoreductase n=1 Tax=Arthrobacter sp. NPDC056727 TaxID=3345927 RepID=UPI00366AC535
MQLLTIFSHPHADTYPAEVMHAFHEPFEQAGYSIDIADLHDEGFDPRFTKDDHSHYRSGGPIPPDVVAMQRRVEAADRLAFIFPVYWWGMPAMMKGWIERVFTGGWAYPGTDNPDGGPRRLRNIPTALIGIGASGQKTYDKYGYDQAMRTQLEVGIFAYCGITDIERHMVYEVEGEHNAPARQEGLSYARSIGAAFSAADRQPATSKKG